LPKKKTRLLLKSLEKIDIDGMIYW